MEHDMAEIPKVKPVLSDEARFNYNFNPDHCPYCKGEDITGGQFEADYGEAWQTVYCNTCSMTWKDIYKFVGMEEEQS